MIPHCKLQFGFTQPILRLFWHICTYVQNVHLGKSLKNILIKFPLNWNSKSCRNLPEKGLNWYQGVRLQVELPPNAQRIDRWYGCWGGLDLYKVSKILIRTPLWHSLIFYTLFCVSITPVRAQHLNWNLDIRNWNLILSVRRLQQLLALVGGGRGSPGRLRLLCGAHCHGQGLFLFFYHVNIDYCKWVTLKSMGARPLDLNLELFSHSVFKVPKQ